jgi:peptidoglycan/xylan/chitin deacetylase (PgdA/CDA1 family)
MKKRIKITGIIILAMVIVFSMLACSGGEPSNNPNNDDPGNDDPENKPVVVGQFLLISPINGDLTETRPEFVWSAATNAEKYKLTIATDAAFTQGLIVREGLTSTSITLDIPLEFGISYHWKVDVTAPAERACIEAFSFTPTPGLNGGVVLNFDDFHSLNWADQFDLFDEYDARVTFFISRTPDTQRPGNPVPTIDELAEFMQLAESRGHEAGWHTFVHPHLSNSPYNNQSNQTHVDNFRAQTIDAISLFAEHGIELTTFAYPFGNFAPWHHEELLKYFKVVRGFDDLHDWNYSPARFRGYDDLDFYTSEEMKSGYLMSASIDQFARRNQDDFETYIKDILGKARDEKLILGITSHYIASGDWGITRARLEYVLQQIQEFGLPFYRYKDFQ